MKIKGLPTAYIDDSTFVADSMECYNFGVKTDVEYVIITKKDYHALNSLVNKVNQYTKTKIWQFLEKNGN